MNAELNNHNDRLREQLDAVERTDEASRRYLQVILPGLRQPEVQESQPRSTHKRPINRVELPDDQEFL